MRLFSKRMMLLGVSIATLSSSVFAVDIKPQFVKKVGFKKLYLPSEVVVSVNNKKKVDDCNVYAVLINSRRRTTWGDRNLKEGLEKKGYTVTQIEKSEVSDLASSDVYVTYTGNSNQRIGVYNYYLGSDNESTKAVFFKFTQSVVAKSAESVNFKINSKQAAVTDKDGITKVTLNSIPACN